MKIHAIQTGTVRVKQFQLTGASNNLSRFYQLVFTQKWCEWLPIYCWLIEHPEGLILVDVGETAKIYEKGYLPDGGLYHKAVQTRITPEEEIPHQLEKLGFQTSDIKKVILTHLHGDHIGGLEYFEHCDMYVSRTEYEMATSKGGPGAGYFQKNWPTWFKPQLVEYTDGAQGVFKVSKTLSDDGSLSVVPTPGHSAGHQSVLLKSDDCTFFIGGDITYNLDTLDKEIPGVVLMNKAAKESVRQAKQFAVSQPTVYLSSHDWNAPEILKNKQLFRV